MKFVTLKKPHFHNGLLHPIGAVLEVGDHVAAWMEKYIPDHVVIKDKGESNVLAVSKEKSKE